MGAYKWKTGYFKTDANVAGAVCEQLEKTVGLNATTLLDASRPQNAPLHDEFEWDDGIAAERYRETQARKIIHNLELIVEEYDVEPIRAFFTIEPKQNGTNRNYESTTVIMNVGEKRNALLDIALRELENFRRKYAGLTELARVFEAIDSVIDDNNI